MKKEYQGFSRLPARKDVKIEATRARAVNIILGYAFRQRERIEFLHEEGLRTAAEDEMTLVEQSWYSLCNYLEFLFQLSTSSPRASSSLH